MGQAPKESTILEEELEPPFGPMMIWFEGLSGTRSGVRIITRNLEKTFPETQVEAVPSTISQDIFENGQELPIEQIAARLRLDRKVTLIGHSSGVIKLLKTIRAVELSLARDPADNDKLNNIEIILVSPAGFIDSWAELARMIRGMVELARINPPVPQLASFRQGVESTIYHPPRFKNIKLDDFNQVLTEIFAKHSQRRLHLRTVEFIPGEETYLSQIEDVDPERAKKIQAKVEKHEENQDEHAVALDSLLERNVANYLQVQREMCERELESSETGSAESSFLARRMLRMSGQSSDRRKDLEKRRRRYARAIISNLERRGRLLTPEMKDAYEGGGGGNIKTLSALWQALQGLVEMVSQAGRGKPYKALARYRDKGINIKFVVPEFDPLVSVDQILQFVITGQGDIEEFWLADVDQTEEQRQQSGYYWSPKVWHLKKESIFWDPFLISDDPLLTDKFPWLLDLMLMGSHSHASYSFDAEKMAQAIDRLMRGR